MGIFPRPAARRRRHAPRAGGLTELNQRSYNAVTATLFLVIALLHLLRIVFGWPAQIGNLNMPQWLSWAALVVSGALGWFGFRLSGRRGTD
jgi:hypothetical protein